MCVCQEGICAYTFSSLSEHAHYLHMDWSEVIFARNYGV